MSAAKKPRVRRFTVPERFGLSNGHEFDAVPRALKRLAKKLDLQLAEAAVLEAVAARYRPETALTFSVSVNELTETICLDRSNVHRALLALGEKGILGVFSEHGKRTVIDPTPLLVHLRHFIATSTVAPTRQLELVQLSRVRDSTVAPEGGNCRAAEPTGEDKSQRKTPEARDAPAPVQHTVASHATAEGPPETAPGSDLLPPLPGESHRDRILRTIRVRLRPDASSPAAVVSKNLA